MIVPTTLKLVHIMAVAENLTIEELGKSGKLSDCAIMACRRNHIGDLETLLTYYYDNDAFPRLIGIDRITRRELRTFCKEFETANLKLLSKGKLQSRLDELETLSPEAVEIFDCRLEKLRLSLSTRTTNVLNVLCPIFTAENIIRSFLNIDLEFFSIQNVGLRTVGELEFLCEALVEPFEHAGKPEVFYDRSSTINGLRDIGKISDRAAPFCERNHIGDLETLLICYRENEEFSHLIGIDRIIGTELRIFCKEFESGNSESLSKGKLQSLLTDIETLSPEARNIFDTKLEKLRLSLTTGTKKFLNNLFGIFAAEKLIGYFLDLDLKFSGISNARVKNIRELASLCEAILQLNKYVRKPLVLYEARLENFIVSIRELSGRFGDDVDIFLRENFQSLQTEDFPLVKFLELCIFNTNFIRTKERRLIFAKFHLSGSEKAENLKMLAEEYHLTKDQIRRLVWDRRVEISFWGPIKKLLDRLRNFGMPANFFTVAGSDKDVIFLHSNSGNAESSTSFSGEFLVRIASMLSPEYHIHYSEKEQRSFLVHQNLDRLVDIDIMLGALERILTRRVYRSFKIKTGDFVQQFRQANSDDREVQKRIQSGLEIIVSGLYGISIDMDGSLEIPRNAKKLKWEYIKDLLEKEGKPLHIKVIAERLAPLGIHVPTGFINTNGMGPANVFALASYGTYGLRSWKEAGMFHGGTITGIMDGYLEAESEPKHVFDIFRFVSKYSVTSIATISTFLGVDRHKRYRSFNSGFYGLISKKYDDSVSVFATPPANWFREVTKVLFEKSESVCVQDIIDYAVKRFEMKAVQVEFLLDKRVKRKEIFVLEDGTVRLS